VSEAAASADACEADARRDALARCVERLQPKHRDLLARRFADGATTQSTSEQVGRSVEAVYKSLAKIRQTLFDCVQQTLAREAKA
jgi:RNA polymerase sigma-70 factor (ECF subfamily)